MKSFFSKMCGLLASLALAFSVIGASQTCIWLYHQPEVPESLNKYRK